MWYQKFGTKERYFWSEWPPRFYSSVPDVCLNDPPLDWLYKRLDYLSDCIDRTKKDIKRAKYAQAFIQIWAKKKWIPCETDQDKADFLEKMNSVVGTTIYFNILDSDRKRQVALRQEEIKRLEEKSFVVMKTIVKIKNYEKLQQDSKRARPKK